MTARSRYCKRCGMPDAYGHTDTCRAVQAIDRLYSQQRQGATRKRVSSPEVPAPYASNGTRVRVTRSYTNAFQPTGERPEQRSGTAETIGWKPVDKATADRLADIRKRREQRRKRSF